MKKRLLTAALVLCLLLALMPAAAAYTPEDCVNYYGGHDWQQGAVVVQPSGVLAGQREWTCRRCGRNGYTYIDPPIRAYEQFYDVDPNCWSYDGISYFTNSPVRRRVRKGSAPVRTPSRPRA